MPWPVGPVDPRTKLDALAPPDDSTKLDASTKRHGLMPKLTGNPAQVLTGAGTFATPGSGAPLNVTDSTFNILDDVTPSKIAQFQCALITPATTRIYSFPDGAGTLALLELNQTWSGDQTFGDVFVNNTLNVFEQFNFYVSAPIRKLAYYNDIAAGQVATLELPTAPLGFSGAWVFPNSAGSILVLAGTAGLLPAAGSLIYGAGTTTAMAALGIGASGTVLTSSGSAPQWSTNASIVDIARTWATLQKFKDSTFLVGDDADITKALVFSLGGATAGKTMTLLSSHTLDRTLTLPDVTGTLATLENAQTFSALQTFDANAVGGPAINILSPQGAGAYGDGTSMLKISDVAAGFGLEWQFAIGGLTANRLLVIPDGSGVLILAAATQTVTNKTLSITGNLLKSSTAASGVAFSDNTTASKQLRMILSGATGNNSFTISSTAPRNYMFPDAAIVVAGSAAALTSGKIPVAGAGGILADMVASSAYTPTNVSTDRSYDANATTLDEVADVLGTLIADLQAKGVLG